MAETKSSKNNPGAEYMAELERLRAENQALRDKAAKKQVLSWKVSDKGGVSVYGLNARFPLTLYGDQWTRLFAVITNGELPDFVATQDKAGKLSHKPV